MKVFFVARESLKEPSVFLRLIFLLFPFNGCHFPWIFYAPDQGRNQTLLDQIDSAGFKNKNARLKIMQDCRGWMFGRAAQKIAIVSAVAEQQPGLDVSKLSTELL
ncbi:MAG TPA: hypothetical protein VK941_04975 [Gillisia sp.]|nr:hypothetical protein [Gillisia sp.]